MKARDVYQQWLESPVVDEKTKEDLRERKDDPEEIEELFHGPLRFGTAGLRGKMRPGTAGMNIYTVRQVTRALADRIREAGGEKRGVCLAFDSRHNSQSFAEETARVLCRAGIKAYLFEKPRPTPELSFAVRETGALAGINITASHNTKEYNGYKVYWEDGAQIDPQLAEEIAARMETIDPLEPVEFADEKEELLVPLGSAMDEKYMRAVLREGCAKAYVDQYGKDLKIIYTPFHGAGREIVPEVLRRDGFQSVIPVAEQMVLDGDFPTVLSPNPEYLEGFAMAISLAEKEGADLIIGTDPDSDRCGVVVKDDADYEILTGNQLGVLLLDFVIRMEREEGRLTQRSAVLRSNVSTRMADAICERNGLPIFETPTGFKYIGKKIREFEETGSYDFLFGFEESNGYLKGTYARDKDAVLASLLTAEMACLYRKEGKTIKEALQGLYDQYGYYSEKVMALSMEGKEGREKTRAIMEGLREHPPEAIAGLPVQAVQDYRDGEVRNGSGQAIEKIDGVRSDMLTFRLEGGSHFIVRPSGTEPKIKFYVMMRGADEKEAIVRQGQGLEEAKDMVSGV